MTVGGMGFIPERLLMMMMMILITYYTFYTVISPSLRIEYASNQ